MYRQFKDHLLRYKSNEDLADQGRKLKLDLINKYIWTKYGVGASRIERVGFLNLKPDFDLELFQNDYLDESYYLQNNDTSVEKDTVEFYLVDLTDTRIGLLFYDDYAFESPSSIKAFEISKDYKK